MYSEPFIISVLSFGALTMCIAYDRQLKAAGIKTIRIIGPWFEAVATVIDSIFAFIGKIIEFIFRAIGFTIKVLWTLLIFAIVLKIFGPVFGGIIVVLMIEEILRG